MTDIRDTKFAGFAELLFAEIMSTEAMSDVTRFLRDDDITEFHTLIAQRAYDLAYHILYETGSGMERAFGIPYKLEQVPDLTQWPD